MPFWHINPRLNCPPMNPWSAARRYNRAVWCNPAGPQCRTFLSPRGYTAPLARSGQQARSDRNPPFALFPLKWAPPCGSRQGVLEVSGKYYAR